MLVVGLIAFEKSSQATVALSGSGLGSSSPKGGLTLLAHNLFDSPVLVLGNQGLNDLGWLDTPMPPIVYVPVLVVCAFLVMAGFGRLSWMKTLVTVAGMFMVLAIPMYLLQVSHLSVGEGVQPRYILPLLPVVSLVLLTGYRPEQAVRLSRPAAWIAWALVSIANSMALMVNIQRYTTGVDGHLFPGQDVEWWSTNRVGPLPTWILGSLGFAIAAWMIVRLSNGPDAPVSAVSGPIHNAVEPASLSADETASAPTLPDADPHPTPVETTTTEPEASIPATPRYKMSDPESPGTTAR
jgi:hypothetical protein